MSNYEMKKSLRKAPGAPKSYAQPQQEPQISFIQPKEKEVAKQSIFQHKNWTLKQKIKLMVFLSFYQVLSDWNSQRKSIYLYKHLSNFLKRSRTPQQCKNIHSLLKRKFTSIQQTVENMQYELSLQQNFDKLLLKYEKDMVNFEKQNKLFQRVYQEQIYEPISSKRATERVNQEIRLYHTTQQKMNTFNDVNLGPIVKCEDQSIFEQKRNQILERCNFHFKEWLLYTTILQHRQGDASSQSQQCGFV